MGGCQWSSWSTASDGHGPPSAWLRELVALKAQQRHSGSRLSSTAQPLCGLGQLLLNLSEPPLLHLSNGSHSTALESKSPAVIYWQFLSPGSFPEHVPLPQPPPIHSGVVTSSALRLAQLCHFPLSTSYTPTLGCVSILTEAPDPAPADPPHSHPLCSWED